MVTVLFICTGNAARSQMAEGLLKNMDSSLTVLSAGTKPEGLSQKAVITMKKAGFDISDQQSTKITDVDWEKADYAITLCGSANEECISIPWPSHCKRIYWPISDPISQKDYEMVRGKITKKINRFLEKEINSLKSKNNL